MVRFGWQIGRVKLFYESGLPSSPLIQYSGTNIEFGTLIKFIKEVEGHDKKL